MLDFLSARAGGIGIAGVKAHLYTNNFTPAHGDLLAQYTEAAWAGYAAQVLTGWTAAVLDGTFHGLTQANIVTFGNTSGATVATFGYFVTDAAGVILMWAERFAAPPVNILNAQVLALTAIFNDQSEF